MQKKMFISILFREDKMRVVKRMMQRKRGKVIIKVQISKLWK